MKNNVRDNRGFIILALAILAILAIGIGFILFGSTEKAQLENCNTTLKKLEAARQEYEQLKVEGDTHKAPKACEKINSLIDRYNENKCAELTGIVSEKEKCK